MERFPLMLHRCNVDCKVHTRSFPKNKLSCKHMGSVPFNMNLLKKEYEKLCDMGIGGTQEPFFNIY